MAHHPYNPIALTEYGLGTPINGVSCLRWSSGTRVLNNLSQLAHSVDRLAYHERAYSWLGWESTIFIDRLLLAVYNECSVERAHQTVTQLEL